MSLVLTQLGSTALIMARSREHVYTEYSCIPQQVFLAKIQRLGLAAFSCQGTSLVWLKEAVEVASAIHILLLSRQLRLFSTFTGL